VELHVAVLAIDLRIRVPRSQHFSLTLRRAMKIKLNWVKSRGEERKSSSYVQIIHESAALCFFIFFISQLPFACLFQREGALIFRLSLPFQKQNNNGD
jgi:hypothetical protein